MEAIYRAAIDAVDPYRLVAAEDLSQAPPYLLALGKAALPMTRAALDQRHFQDVLVVAPGGELPGVRVLHGSHPVPDERSLAAGEAILEFAQKGELLVLLSGGGSALAEAPRVTLEELRRTTRALLAGGVPIERINVVRRHLSRLKGGHLARLTPCHTLALSDVLFSPPEAIASGPTAPDPTTVQDALHACRGLDLPFLPFQETVKPGDPCFESCRYKILADNRTLAQAAVAAWPRSQLATWALQGEARQVARELSHLSPGRWVASGEPTVTLKNHDGKGGRCQELALAFALLVEGQNARLLAAGSDGIDGPTDAAGAIVDGETCARARALGFDPQRHLEENNAYPLLEAVGALLKPGPTGTNANDLCLIEL